MVRASLRKPVERNGSKCLVVGNHRLLKNALVVLTENCPSLCGFSRFECEEYASV